MAVKSFRKNRAAKSLVLIVVSLSLTTTPALAVKCSNTSAGFAAFKRNFAKEAAAAGVGRRGLAALATAKYSKSVIRKDRNQKSFKKGFKAFYKLRTTGLAKPAKRKMAQYARALQSIDCHHLGDGIRIWPFHRQ